MLIDTHAHLANDNLFKNIDEIITNAKKANIEKIISIGCSIEEAKKSIDLAEKYDCIYATAGLYPKDYKPDESSILSIDRRLEEIEKHLLHPKVVAVGEAGMDFIPASPEELERSEGDQLILFEKQIELAKKYNKPLIIHSRNSTEETIKIIKKNENSVLFIWHCFMEGPTVTKILLKTSCVFSISGAITYKNKDNLKESVKLIPINRLLIETDSPYLSPYEKRLSNTANEPAFITYIAKAISQIKNLDVNLVNTKTTQNAIQIFKF